MANPQSQARTPAPQNPSPEPASQPGLIDRLRARIDALVGRATGNRRIRRVLAVISVANDTGANLFAAALAFGTMFALIPLVLLVSGVIGWLIDDPARRAALLQQLVAYVPPLADFFRSSLEGVVAGRGALSIIGLIGLLWGSSAFYGVLDEVMRRIFSGGGARNELSRRIRGFATILILLVVIVGTVSLGGLWAVLDQLVGDLFIWRYAGPLISLGVMVLIALVVYLIVPTAPPSLRAAFWPAVVAGVGIGLLTNLFSLLAPLLIGAIAGFGVIATIFGALVWLNFSYQILLWGAAWARVRRDRERNLGTNAA